MIWSLRKNCCVIAQSRSQRHTTLRTANAGQRALVRCWRPRGKAKSKKILEPADLNRHSVASQFKTLQFWFARTMPETPHEYVRRTPENEEAYALLFQKIG